jgi:tmRNA-binding protein
LRKDILMKGCGIEAAPSEAKVERRARTNAAKSYVAHSPKIFYICNMTPERTERIQAVLAKRQKLLLNPKYL